MDDDTMDDDTTASTLTIDFCGERHACTPGRTFSVGRDADLSIDDNRYLHRRLLEFEWASGMWWMTNCGQSITVGVATADGTYQAMLGPAGRMPLVSSPLSVVFSAGPFTYELGVILDGSSANPAPDAALPVSTGADTVGNARRHHLHPEPAAADHRAMRTDASRRDGRRKPHSLVRRSRRASRVADHDLQPQTR